MSLRPAPLLAAVAAFSLACAGARARPGAGAHAAHSFPVEGHGSLRLSVPAGWAVRQSPDEGEGKPRTVELAPPDRAFVALLTPFPNPAQGETSGADAAQIMAELARRKAADTAEEREIALQELRGEDGVHGYWFAATDRSMKDRPANKDEYRHLMQGATAVGDVLVAFTLLDNADGPQRQQLLELLRGARQVDGAEPDAPEKPSKQPGTPKDRAPSGDDDGQHVRRGADGAGARLS